jgi:hypothetical protein
MDNWTRGMVLVLMMLSLVGSVYISVLRGQRQDLRREVARQEAALVELRARLKEKPGVIFVERKAPDFESGGLLFRNNTIHEPSTRNGVWVLTDTKSGPLCVERGADEK